MRIEHTVQIWMEGDHYIGHAPPLDVMSSGGSGQKARMGLPEAAGLFSRAALEMGTLKEVLEQSGYELRSGNWTSH